jgi:L-threonylcarbamoyladenylate synthase
LSRTVKIDIQMADLQALYKAFEEVGEIFSAGGIIAYPTETVYGLGVDAMNPEAIKRLAGVKGRAGEKPFSVLVANNLEAGMLAKRISKATALLMDHFWPGPLTLVLQASRRASSELLGGGNTIGLRFSSHPVSRLLRLFSEHPVTATSANTAGDEPARTATDVEAALGKQVDLILDAGETPLGLPSTVVDVTGDRAVVLRVGAVSIRQLERVIGKVEIHERR